MTQKNIKNFYVMAIVVTVSLYGNVKYIAEPTITHNENTTYYAQAQTSADYAYDKALDDFVKIKEGRMPSVSKKEKIEVNQCNEISHEIMFSSKPDTPERHKLVEKYKDLNCSRVKL